MLFSLILAGAMSVGVLFLREMSKAIGNVGQAGPFFFVALMFVWDGLFAYMITDYATGKEMAIGIALGTLIKTLLLLKLKIFKI